MDTGASSTVCGRTWYSIFEDSLTEEEKAEIVTEKTDKSFRFGDGVAVKATAMKRIPITMCGNAVMLRVCIVENDIPLLLSNETIRNMKLIINYEEDKIHMGKGEDDIQLTRSGHPVVPINM